MKIGPWIVALLAVSIVVLATIYGTLLGDWVDANSAVTIPSFIPVLALVAIAVVVFLVAVALGVVALIERPQATKNRS